MAQCIACESQVRVYQHYCPSCGARVPRGLVHTSIVRYQARLCHLLALPGMVLFVVSFPAFGVFALAPLNLIIPMFYRWCHPKSPTIRSHTTEVLNFQVLWTVTVAALGLIVVFTLPISRDFQGKSTTFYVPSQSTTVEITLSEDVNGSTQPDKGSFWALTTIAYGMFVVAWPGGIALSAFLAYDLGNGESGRYPLRVPLFRLE